MPIHLLFFDCLYLGNLCKNIIPIYIGSCRAIGRTCNNGNLIPLFLRLFPEPTPPPSSDHSQAIGDSSYSNTTSVNGTLTKKRPANGKELLPRSLSSVSANNGGYYDVFPSRDSGADLLSSFNNSVRVASFHSQISTNFVSSDGQNESQVLFYKYGSCFSQLTRSKYHDYVSIEPTKLYRFSLSHLQTILSIAKKLLNRDLLINLDEQVREFSITTHSDNYPYTSVSEIMTLVTVGVFREMFQDESGLPYPLTKDVYEFFRELLKIHQKLLISKHLEHQSIAQDNPLSTYKLTLYIMAACVDITVWSADETTGISLCSELADKINLSHGHKSPITQSPLVVACLDSLGRLSQKYPPIAEDSVPFLREFLLNPSPILLRLSRQLTEIPTRTGTLNISISYDGASQPLSTNNSSQTNVFEHLRDRAIHNLCVALRSGYKVVPHFIQEFIASLANHPYHAENSDTESKLVATNTILTLGKVAVNLADIPRTMESILTFFQQRFCHPASSLDTLIVEQLGKMVLVTNREVSLLIYS